MSSSFYLIINNLTQKLTFFWFFLHFRNLWRSASFPFPFGCRSRMFNNLNFSIRYIRFTRKFVIRLEWVNIVEILWCRGRRLVLISIFVWFWARWIFFKFTVDNVTTIFLCLYFLLFLFFRRILEKQISKIRSYKSILYSYKLGSLVWTFRAYLSNHFKVLSWIMYISTKF